MRFTALFVVALLALSSAATFRYKILKRGDFFGGDTLIHCIVKGENLTGVDSVTAEMCDFAGSVIPANWRLKSCITKAPEDEPVQDVDLSAKAIIARAVLGVSPKLKDNAQIQFQLDLLAQAVEMAAGADVTLTYVAVQAINDILAHPAIKANPDLWQALENARKQVVETTNGSVD